MAGHAGGRLVAIDVVHYYPWESTPALLAGVAHLLAAGGALYCYSLFRRGGRHTAPSNEAFDGWLKYRGPRFGVRDLKAVEAEAAVRRLRLDEVIEMPANNYRLLFRKQDDRASDRQDSAAGR